MKYVQLFVGVLVGLVVGACATASVTAKDAASEAKVISADEAPKRWTPDGKAHATMLAKGNNAYLGLLEMEGDGKVPEHRDPTEEFIYFLSGSGTMHIDDQTYEVGTGSAIYMPTDAKVSFEGAGGEKIRVVQVFAGPGPSKKYDKWNKSTP